MPATEELHACTGLLLETPTLGAIASQGRRRAGRQPRPGVQEVREVLLDGQPADRQPGEAGPAEFLAFVVTRVPCSAERLECQAVGNEADALPGCQAALHVGLDCAL